jgi:hypothetical protein
VQGRSSVSGHGSCECGGLFRADGPGHWPGVEQDIRAERIRSLVVLRAKCDAVLDRLDEDDIDDLALAVVIGEFCDTLEAELERFADYRR